MATGNTEHPCENVETLLQNLNHLTPRDLKDTQILRMLKVMSRDETLPQEIRATARNMVNAANCGVREQGVHKLKR